MPTLTAPPRLRPSPRPAGARATGRRRPRAVRIAAGTAAAGFCLVAAFHAALVAGAPWGELTQGGTTNGALDTPGRLVAAGSAVLMLAMAGAVLARAGLAWRHLRRSTVTRLAWLTVLTQAASLVLNLLTESASERAVWAPTSLVLLLLVAYVMAATRRAK